MNWLVLAGSLVAILALAGIARLLRLGRDGKVEDAGAAAQAAEDALAGFRAERSEEHTSELQSLMRISYAVFCSTKKKVQNLMVMTTHRLMITSSRTQR